MGILLVDYAFLFLFVQIGIITLWEYIGTLDIKIRPKFSRTNLFNSVMKNSFCIALSFNCLKSLCTVMDCYKIRKPS